MLQYRYPRRDFLKQLGATAVLPALAGGQVSNVTPGRPAHDAMNILIIVLDALSAKNMSLYGYPRNTTPHLSKLAQESVVYHAHYAAGSFTPSGTASLLTGTYPWTHRALHHAGMLDVGRVHQHLFTAFPDHHRFAYTHNPWVTLQLQPYRSHVDDLIGAGDFALQDLSTDCWMSARDTAAFHGVEDFAMQEPNPGTLYLLTMKHALRAAGRALCEHRHGRDFPRGVPDFYGMLYRLEDAVDGMLEKIARCPRPFLGYVHVLPPHSPYSPPRKFVGALNSDWQPATKPRHPFRAHTSEAELRELRLQYDENIAYADAEVGRLLSRLRATGELDRTCVVVTSDHGEFFERGIFEHDSPHLFDPVIRTPLLIRLPGGTVRQSIHTFTNAVDVLPTLLALAGMPAQSGCEGQILPPFAGADASGARCVYALDARMAPKNGPMTSGTVACVSDPYKLIYYSGYKACPAAMELFDIRNDPEEINDLADAKPGVARSLRQQVLQQLDAAAFPPGSSA